MIRRIAGFHQDDEGSWVAELTCLHNQHVRHQPPFRERPWVLSESGRTSRIGSEIDCPLCDRAELPDGLRRVRTAGPFDAETIPAALRTTHRVAEGRWGHVRVTEGSVVVSMQTSPPIRARLRAGDRQPIPPEVPHVLEVEGPVNLTIDFLVRDADGASTTA